MDMGKKKKKSQGGISIGGNVNTGGGAIAGRDIVNNYVTNENKSEVSHNVFAPIYESIQQISTLDNIQKEKLEENCKSLENEIEKDNVDTDKLEKILKNIIKLAPDIFDVIISTISNPIIGLSTVIQKITKKVQEEI